MKLDGRSFRMLRVSVVTDGVGFTTCRGAPTLNAGGASSSFGFRLRGSSGQGIYSGIPPMRQPTASLFLHRVGRPESRLMGVFRRFVRRRIARDMGRMLVSSKCFLIALEEPIAVVDALERLLLDLAMVLLQLLLSLLPRGVVVVWNMFRKSSRLPEAKEHPSSQNSWPTSLGISAEDVARRSPFCILLLDCLRVLDLVTVIDILVTELVNACLHCSRRFEGGIRI
eukprot:CAMPEP_0181537826 /NCGR_PEP_ID=MMETSP1110-20121109/75552_1 /TAXON_ID=174948 /ORGANISM="Symbiodinium sp., Strain CCMP421" /LENGTH=225 /DNA_ID=CAMNT_0023669411 /DNA_START=96 /DNA_END=773 /DNA_ORIENTATION=-